MNLQHTPGDGEGVVRMVSRGWVPFAQPSEWTAAAPAHFFLVRPPYPGHAVCCCHLRLLLLKHFKDNPASGPFAGRVAPPLIFIRKISSCTMHPP